MKKTLSFLFMLVFVLSTIVFSNSFHVDELRNEASKALLHKTVNTGIDTIVDEINNILPIDQKDSVDALKRKIETDPLVNSMIDKYSLIVLHDLSTEKSDTSINNDVHLALDTYTKEIADLTGDVISPKYREILVKELVNRIDFDQIYHQKLGSFKADVSPKQMKVIKLMDFLFTNLKTIQKISLSVSIVSLLFIFLINIKESKYFNYLAISLFFSSIADVLSRLSLNVMMQRFTSSLFINLKLPLITKITVAMFSLAILIKIMGYFIKKLVIKH